MEKTYFQIKLINYEGVIILSTGETPGDIFAANAHRSYSMSFAYFYLHHALDKNSYVEALYANSYGKIKSRKKSLGKENETTGPKKKEKAPFCQAKKKTLPKATKALGLSVDSLTSCSSAEHFPPLTLLARVLPLPLPLASLPNITWSSWIELHLVERDKKKTCCNGTLFPGNRDLLSETQGGPVFPLACGFIKRYNLRKWRELSTNLYKLKSRIWFLEEYIHFERIYRVCRFDGLSWNFARTFKR